MSNAQCKLEENNCRSFVQSYINHINYSKFTKFGIHGQAKYLTQFDIFHC